MEFLSALWLPIIISAVLVWVASFLCHMVLPHHKKEWSGLPNEDKLMDSMQGVPAGLYMFPFCSMSDMNSPENVAKRERGPNGLLVIRPGTVNMGMNLALTLLFYLVVGVFVAYVVWHTLQAGDAYLEKFRICGAVAFCAHGLGWMPHLIWFRTGKFWPNLFDSVLYALITAGSFGGFWHAPVS